MSADNGIYIGKFKDISKVIHTGNIENINYHFDDRKNFEFNYAHIYNIYKDAPSLPYDAAEKAAILLEKELEFTEYGINTIVFPIAWNEIIIYAQKDAAQELPYLKRVGYDSLVETYEEILLDARIFKLKLLLEP